ncbi:MAG: class I SAM-dependent methyltransferase, partial [bacterium]
MDKWYLNFFYGVAQDFWIKTVPKKITDTEVRFIMDVIGPAEGKFLLDLLCGFGRHAIELAERGYKVTGVDISREYIYELKQTAWKAKFPLEALEGDILSIEINKLFDGIYCLGNSFGYFDHEGMDLFIQKIAGWLKSGGKFILHTAMAAETILPNFQGKEEVTIGDINLLMHHIYNTGESFIETNYSFFRAGVTERRVSRHYIYTLAEIKKMLLAVG